MRTKIRAIKILALCCLLMGVVAVLLGMYTPGAQTQKREEAVYPITDISVAEFAALAVTNSRMNFGLLQKGEELEIVSETEGSYDLGELRSLVYAACHLTGSRKLEDQSVWESYGYTQPQAEVSVIKADGTTANFNILSQNPIDGNYYVFSQQEQAVFLVSKQVAELFLRAESDFFSHTVFPAITVENYAQMESVSLDFGGEGRDYTLVQSSGAFRLSKPIEHKVPTVTVLQELLNYVSGLYSDRFVASGVTLSDYGFDQYTLRIQMTFDGKEYSALLLDQGNDVCLMADEKSGTVYEVQSANLAAITRDYLTLLGGKVYQYSPGDLLDVTAEVDGKELFVQFSGEGEALQAEALGKTLSTDETTALMGALCGAQIEREAAGTAVQGTAEVTLTFTLRSGSKETIEFVPQVGGDYAVYMGGVSNFITTAQSVEAIRSAIRESIN